MLGGIVFSEIPDERPLVRFFIENGLEYSESDEVATDLVKCWKAEELVEDRLGEAQDGTGNANLRLVGGCVLAKREGRFICDGIATDPSVRGLRVGESLLFTMTEEAKKRGADSIYLVARAPAFFAKYGFVSVPREDAPKFFECFTCPQYGVSCFPEVMRLAL